MTTLEQIETRAAEVASVLRRLGRGACPRKQAERAAQALHDCWETESRRLISEKTQLSMLVYEQYRAIELPSFRASEPYASRVAEHISAPVNIASAYCERLQQRMLYGDHAAPTRWPCGSRRTDYQVSSIASVQGAVLEYQFACADFVGINPARSPSFAFSPANH